MGPTSKHLAQEMSEKSDQALLDMFTNAGDWTPEALDAAREELDKRNIPVPDAVFPEAPESSLYEITPSGRKRLLRATGVDILISVFLPGWGVIVGGIAYVVKRERKRGITMMAIGVAVIILLIASRTR